MVSTAVTDNVEGRKDVTFYKASEQYYRAYCSSILDARPTLQLPAAAGVPLPGPSATPLYEYDAACWVKPEAAAVLAAGREEPGSDGVITLPMIQHMRSKYHVEMLPSHSPDRVVPELIMPVKGRWGEAAQSCLQLVADELHRLSNRLVQEAFADFSAAQGYVRQVEAA
jgi:hypothetical protein